MDQRTRIINYVRQNYGHDLELTTRIVDHALEPSEYEKVSVWEMLKPQQLKRIKHKRGEAGGHRRRQRERRHERLMRQVSHWTEVASVLKRRNAQ